MRVETVIRNGLAVTPSGVQSADIAIDSGKIAGIGKPGLFTAKETIDAKGNYVLPGLVDPHVHCRFEHENAREAIAQDSASAAAGGVTTVGNMMRAYKVSPLELFKRQSEVVNSSSLIDMFFHVIVTGRNLKYIPALPEKGITSFKFMMAYKGPQAKMAGIPPVDDGVLFDGFERISKLGKQARALVHCENIEIALVLRQRLEEAGRKDMPAWQETRPRFVEAEAMRRVIYLAQVTGCPLYIVHVSIGEGPQMIAEARAAGIDVISETCPQYLTQSSEGLAPIFVKHPTWGNVNPPLRDKWSNEKLWQGIRDGWIDCVGSDYAPLTLEQKGGDIWHSHMGNGLTELILPIMMSEGVNRGRISIEKLVEVCCYNPARVFGLLPRKGIIAVGADADIVIVDPKKKVRVSNKTLHSPFIGWTIWQGWELTGWPVLTMLRGDVIVEGGKIVGRAGCGRYIGRNISPGS